MSTTQTATTKVGATFGGPVRDDPSAPPTARPRWTDVAAVVALTVLTLATLPLVDLSSTVDRDADGFAVLIVLLAAVATVLRRYRPVEATLVVGALVATYLVLGYPYGTVFGFVVLSVYSVARHRPPSASGWVAAVACLALTAHLPTNAASAGTFGLLIAAAWVAIPYTIGVARRVVAAAHDRERRVADERLLADERLRLSQEVHDVVGHGLAAIQMQADITLHLADPRPERTRAALEAISEASRTALDELRTTLASVRGRDDDAERAPTPGLSLVDELCRRVADAGFEVRVERDGDPVPLPAEADLVAYRVLQESLTNVVKHSAHPRADVRIEHTPDAVTLEVTNQDLAPDPTEGIGIMGMRRRVTRLGGTIAAGPGPRRGTFRVRAVVPRGPEARA